VKPALRIVRDPDDLTDRLRATLAATEARRYFDGACVRCGRTAEEHTLLGAMACGLAAHAAGTWRRL
jgi:hypothetical protein